MYLMMLGSATITFLQNNAAFLPWIGKLNTLGLSNGTLYEVLTDAQLQNGTATVSAVGFNITCWGLPANNITQMSMVFPGMNLLPN
jgi:hypothetical protein